MIPASTFSTTLLHQDAVAAGLNLNMDWPITILTAWQVSPTLSVGTGEMGLPDIPVLVTLTSTGSSQIVGLNVIGGPGPAYIVGMQNGSVVMLQGAGYESWDPTTGAITRTDQDGNPLQGS